MAGDLISRIKETKTHGIQYSKSSSLKQKRNDMRAFDPHLKEAKTSLTKTLSLSKSLSDLGRVAPFDAEEIQQALSQVTQDLNNGNFNPWNAEKLKRAVKEVERACNTEWNDFVEEQIGSTRSILQSIRGVASEEIEYQEMRKAEAQLSRSEPGSTGAINAIRSYLQHFNKLIEELHLDDEVLDFLKKVTENNAVSLSDLSNSCLEKLRSESFSGKLKIVIG